MDLLLSQKPLPKATSPRLPGSKSITNRLLMLGALAQQPLELQGAASCDDSDAMAKALETLATPATEATFDIGHAGTAMRFLTALLATRPGTWTLTGSERMKQRPIGLLVNALRSLGAQIDYLGQEGFPPLRLRGAPLDGGHASLAANVSSQFVSALLMVAPTFRDGLTLTLEGPIASRPYLEMTLEAMAERGARWTWEGPTLQVWPGPYHGGTAQVEADWSAASYWFATAALAPLGHTFFLAGLRRDSQQGDAAMLELARPLGVNARFDNGGLWLENSAARPEHFQADMTHTPDIAQTLAVLLCAKGVPFRLTGLESLRIKETDRIHALATELAKFGFLTRAEGDHALVWDGQTTEPAPRPRVKTYHDHRMAMAFAPLVFTREKPFAIEQAEVVSKSYPEFWLQFAKVARVQEVGPSF